MAHYRKIDVRIWNDAKFIDLSSNGKLLFFFLITHPSMTALGAMRATTQGLGAELNFSIKDFEEAFDEVLGKGLAKCNKKACCIWLPNFLKYQSAESPNVIRNWKKQVEFIPECDLKIRAIACLELHVDGLSEGFRKAFREVFSEDYQQSVSTKQLAVSSNPYPGNTSPIQEEDITPRLTETRKATVRCGFAEEVRHAD